MYQLPKPNPPAPDVAALARDYQGAVFNACANHLAGRLSTVYLPADLPATLAVPFWRAVADEMDGTGWRLAGDEPLYRAVVPVEG